MCQPHLPATCPAHPLRGAGQARGNGDTAAGPLGAPGSGPACLDVHGELIGDGVPCSVFLLGWDSHASVLSIPWPAVLPALQPPQRHPGDSRRHRALCLPRPCHPMCPQRVQGGIKLGPFESSWAPLSRWGGRSAGVRADPGPLWQFTLPSAELRCAAGARRMRGGVRVDVQHVNG